MSNLWAWLLLRYRLLSSWSHKNGKEESSFYHVRWHKVGINERVAAEVLGVTVEQVLEWDDLGAPVVAERYLLLWSKKHLGIEWDGWMISRGKLRHKKLMWRPDTLLANRRDAEKTWLLEYELKRLQTWTGVFRTIGKLSKTAASGFVSRV